MKLTITPNCKILNLFVIALWREEGECQLILHSLCYMLPNQHFKLHIYFNQPDMLLTGEWHWVFVNYLLILNLPFCSHTVLMYACMYPPLQGFLYSFCWLIQILHCSIIVCKWAQLSASGFVWHLQQERPHGETWGDQLAMEQGDGVKFNQWSCTACLRFLNLLWPTSGRMAVKQSNLAGQHCFLRLLGSSLHTTVTIPHRV